MRRNYQPTAARTKGKFRARPGVVGCHRTRGGRHCRQQGRGGDRKMGTGVGQETNYITVQGRLITPCPTDRHSQRTGWRSRHVVAGTAAWVIVQRMRCHDMARAVARKEDKEGRKRIGSICFRHQTEQVGHRIFNQERLPNPTLASSLQYWVARQDQVPTLLHRPPKDKTTAYGA